MGMAMGLVWCVSTFFFVQAISVAEQLAARGEHATAAKGLIAVLLHPSITADGVARASNAALQSLVSGGLCGMWLCLAREVGQAKLKRA
jgi:hypothetical protein